MGNLRELDDRVENYLQAWGPVENPSDLIKDLYQEVVRLREFVCRLTFQPHDRAKMQDEIDLLSAALYWGANEASLRDLSGLTLEETIGIWMEKAREIKKA